MRSYQLTALVLRARDFAEADRLVTLLSPQRGKVSALAKGARRPRSKLAAAVQPFCLCTAQLAVGRNLDIITQCQIIHPFYSLHEDLTRLTYASYLAELVDAFVEPAGGSREIFDLLLAALRRLERGNDPQLLARAFELRLLAALGYAPQLGECVGCARALPTGPARFSPAAGGTVCDSCSGAAGGIRLSAPALAALRRFSRGGEQALTTPLPPRLQRELESALRAYIEYRLERPLRTPRLLHRLQPAG